MKSLYFIPAALIISCSSTTPSSSSVTAPKKGMSKEDVSLSLGKPNYQYTIASEETWVYDGKDPKTKLTKSTALNMIPLAGPLISLPGQINPKPTAAETEIKFGANGKVIKITKSTTSTVKS